MQRAALAIAFALNPEILLLDGKLIDYGNRKEDLLHFTIEPTSALDPESTLLVEKSLKGRTCILITHNPQQETRLATQSIYLPRLAQNPVVDDDQITISS